MVMLEVINHYNVLFNGPLQNNTGLSLRSYYIMNLLLIYREFGATQWSCEIMVYSKVTLLHLKAL